MIDAGLEPVDGHVFAPLLLEWLMAVGDGPASSELITHNPHATAHGLSDDRWYTDVNWSESQCNSPYLCLLFGTGLQSTHG